MAQTSSIEWTDATWNPVTGCTETSPGCDHCYARTFAERWRGVPGHPYEQGFDLKLWPARLTLPTQWKKPRRVFVNSMSDLFHKDVPEEFIQQVFEAMVAAPQHTFQVLTKRSRRLARLAPSLPWPAHIWAGVSIESDDYAWRADYLRQVPAAVRFISAEPLLGPLPSLSLAGISQLIVGGESGHGARPFAMEWAGELVARCQAANVPCFVKQVGARPTLGGAPLKLRDKKGGDMSEWPEDLRVRQFPTIPTPQTA
jgi:protein gp37